MHNTLAIFDLDGTLLDTLADLRASTNYALRQFGMPERSLKEVRLFVGNGILPLIQRSVPEGTGREVTEQVLSLFREHYALHCRDATRPYAGIPELLTHLKARGILRAVVSNKADFAVQDLCRHYFGGLLDAVVGERLGVRKKPAPDAIRAVLDQLGISGEQAVYIGDSDVDLETAKNVGMPCISVTWGFRGEDFLRAHGASRIVHTPEELETLLTGE